MGSGYAATTFSVLLIFISCIMIKILLSFITLIWTDCFSSHSTSQWGIKTVCIRSGYREVEKGWFGMCNLLSYKNYNGTMEYSKEVVEELDSSIHFKLTRAIVAMFNNELNTSAQMIFTVHNINLMDCKRMFRKEQI